jgi:signal transduction histidine kinase
LLVEAERARMDDDDALAFQLYDQVVEMASEHALSQIEGLACELAGRFWTLRNKKYFAETYLERAINAYEVWGASGKAADLKREFGIQREKGLTVSVTSDSTVFGDNAQHGDALDLSAIIKASQAIAGEIVLEKLLARMMDIVLENSGAERAVLVLERDGQFFVEAIEEVGEGDARVLLGEPIQQTTHLSRGIANFVIRVAEHVVLDEPAERGRFRRDSYVSTRRPKSVLCAPVSYKGKLRGVIYLENNHVAGAFTQRRLEALNILMSQIAVSIENAMLYEEQERQTHNIERANEALTLEIAERKKAEMELSRYKDHLEELVAQRTRELESAQGRLVEMSRQAGMAEVASGVLHNVGNVMNSVNVGVHLTQDAVKALQVDRLARVAQLLTANEQCLGEYLTSDPAGRKVPEFLTKLAGALDSDKQAIRGELDSLTDHIEHMKQIIAAQQSYAKVAGVSEPCTLEEIVESALSINAAGLRSYDIEVVRDYEELDAAFLDRHQIMQIVVNLISNAKHALGECDSERRRLTIRLHRIDDQFRVEVCDNGLGIEPQNLKKVFNHGFTTKPTGHGFGLHNAANAAQQMDGSLEVQSDGPGKGASFILTIPAAMVDDVDRPSVAV